MKRFSLSANATRVLICCCFLLAAFHANAQYCLPEYAQPACNCPQTWDFINDFSTTGGLTNIANMNSGCNGALPNNYAYVNQTVTVNPGQDFQIYVKSSIDASGCNTNGFPHGFRIWVDWNNDFDFTDLGESEWTSGVSGYEFTGTVTVPSFVSSGLKRMRVRSAYSVVPTHPCDLHSYGETEDYNVFVNPSPCNGMPNAGVATQSTATLIVPGSSFTLSTAASPTVAGNIDYQWEINDDNSNAWLPVGPTPNNPNVVASTPNAVSTEVTGQTDTACYRLRVICTVTSDTAYATPICVYTGNPSACEITLQYTFSNSPFGVQFQTTTNGANGLYTWNFGDGTLDSTTADSQHDFPSTGTYNACVIYTDTASFCADTACVDVTIVPMSLVTGTVFVDANNNHLIDSGEATLAGVNVFANFGQPALTDSNGAYTFYLPAGNHLVSIVPPTYFAQTVPFNLTAYNVSVNGNDTLLDLDFAVALNVVSVSGRVYHDANENGLQDPGEMGIAGQKISKGAGFVMTNADGYYTMVVYNPGQFTLSYLINTPGWSCTNVGGNTFAIAGDTAIYENLDFGVTVDSALHDCGVSIGCQNITGGLSTLIAVSVYNNGLFTETVLLSVHYDSLLNYSASNYATPVSVDEINRVVTYELTLLPASFNNVGLYFLAPTTVTLGAPVHNRASIALVTAVDQVSTNDTAACDMAVIGSYDPNDKHVSPAGVGDEHFVNPNHVTKATYTVRFQNTGTAPAINVTVLDTLDTNTLDIGSIRLTFASHPVTLELNGNVLSTHFAGIMLPDSFTNEPASHGMFVFEINLLPGLQNFTVVSNDAAIYFDYNEPVVTNAAFITLDQKLSNHAVTKAPELQLFPNPADESFTLVTKPDVTQRFEISDVTGRVVQTGFASGQTNVDVARLANGLYSLRVFNGIATNVVKFIVSHNIR